MTGPSWLRSGAAAVVGLTLLFGPGAKGDDRQAVVVEPEDLTKRADLIGREVVVDDRLSLFQYHKGAGFDQILLKRAPEVTFEVPARLRPTQNPSMVGVRVRGVLRHETGRWWCDVAEFEPQPADLDRLNRAVAQLTRADAETRASWAHWGERRGKAFRDAALLKRAREVEGEALRIEAERTTAADQVLKLAERARSAQVPEPEPSALAHRAFRASLAASPPAEELRALVGSVERFFPRATAAVPDAPDLTRWEKPYRDAPADAYRSAPQAARPALDHALWADATQKLLEARAADDPRSLLSVAEDAARLLPDRPGFAAALLEKGLATAASEVGSLRQAEVDNLAALYRDRLNQPERARELYRTWLDDQKNRRLSPRDAEGRIALADQYDALLDDRPTALALLRDAWAIDPQSREVADAFRRRSFRKVKGDWVEGPKPGAAEGTGPGAASGAGVVPQASGREAEPESARVGRSDSLRGATPDEVRARMGGRPNRKVWAASQGRLIEQWIYHGPRLDQYVNILHRPGDPQPRVVSYYSLPRATP